MVLGPAIERLDPQERNSNLFPVKAKGDVLFLSVESLGIGGRTSAPIVIFVLERPCIGVPSLIDCSTSKSSSPTYMDMIAGGASFPPRRLSFPALATEMRKRSWFSSTALITAVKNKRN